MRLIDADAFIERLKKDPFFPLVERYGLTSVIETQKTIDPVKHGRWIGKPIAGYSTVRCSKCGNVLLENDGRFPYCPYCGAKMDAFAKDIDVPDNMSEEDK